MIVMPVAILVRELVARATMQDAKSNPFLTDSVSMRWLGEGYREIVRQCAQAGYRVYNKTMNADLQAQALQDGPSDCLGRLTIGSGALMIRREVGGHAFPAVQRSWGYMRQTWGDFTGSEVGTAGRSHHPIAYDWCFDENSSGIVIQPTPRVAVAGGIVLDYVGNPGALWRNYDPDAATVAVVNGSATWTFVDDITGLIQAGDAVGVKGDAASLPSRWYLIASADSANQVTTTEAYEGVDNATALFTASQVSPVEAQWPGLCEFAPVAGALFKFWQTQAGEAGAQGFRQEFMAEVGRIIDVIDTGKQGETLPAPDALHRHAALRRNGIFPRR